MMKDRLHTRVKVDYKALIKGHGLWAVFKRFKRTHSNIKSERRLMYCFCKSWLQNELRDAILWEQNLDEMIRVVKTPWIED